MRLQRLLPALLVALTNGAAAQGYEAALTRVLRAVVADDGRVDYRALATTHRGVFDGVRASIESYDAGRLTTDRAKRAFLMNAYNVHVLARVLVHPRATNLERDGLFEAFFRTPVRVAGRTMTLNQLENGVLRRQDEVDGRPVPPELGALRPARLDPRIHVGLNCAAVSCPPLRQTAFTAANVDAELDAAFAAWVNSPRLATVEGRRVALSRLLDWYGEDWEREGRPLGDVLLASMSPRRAHYAALRALVAGHTLAALRARDDVRFAYDWTVNRR